MTISLRKMLGTVLAALVDGIYRPRSRRSRAKPGGTAADDRGGRTAVEG